MGDENNEGGSKQLPDGSVSSHDISEEENK